MFHNSCQGLFKEIFIYINKKLYGKINLQHRLRRQSFHSKEEKKEEINKQIGHVHRNKSIFIITSFFFF